MKRGLYYCLKGDTYVFVENVIKNNVVIYSDAINPDRRGQFTASVEDFEKDYTIVNSLDRFEKNMKTEDLLKELIIRQDSPIRDLDLEGAESKVFRRDYVCGYPQYDPVTESNYLPQVIPFDEKEEAFKYSSSHSNAQFKRPRVYKRILIEE